MTAPFLGFLKWNGSKRELAPTLDSSFGPCKGVWRENMIGSGAVFFYRASQGSITRAVLSDANERLISTHLAVRDQIDDVLAELDKLCWGEDYKDHYYGVRNHYNADARTGPLCAARTIWLNKAGFNGLFRENKKGAFNVPVGRYKRPSRPSEAALRRASELLQIAEIRLLDCIEAAALAGEDDQLYSDPPYIPVSNTSAFTTYIKGGFGPSKQRELMVALAAAADRGAQVGYSNSNTPLARALCREFYFTVGLHQVRRSSSAKASGRGRVKEVLAFAHREHMQEAA